MTCTIIDAINNSMLAWLLAMFAGSLVGYMAKGLVDSLVDQKVEQLARRRLGEIEVGR